MDLCGSPKCSLRAREARERRANAATNAFGEELTPHIAEGT